MKKFAFSLIAIVAAFSLGAVKATAGYIPIGGIDTSDGSLTEWNMGPGGDLSSSTCAGGGSLCLYTDYVDVTASSQTGSLSGVGSAEEPLSLTYSPTTGLEGQVWDFCNGGDTPNACGSTLNPVVLTFTVTGPVTVVLSNGSFLNLDASGVWSEAGFTDTPGTFSGSWTDSDVPGNYGQTGSNVGGTESFNVDAPPPVPEPSTLVLLGTGLLGAAVLLFHRNHITRNTSIT